MTAPQPEPLSAVVAKARRYIRELCSAERRWTLSVPARPGEDPDLVLSDALDAQSAEIERLKALLAEVPREFDPKMFRTVQAERSRHYSRGYNAGTRSRHRLAVENMRLVARVSALESGMRQIEQAFQAVDAALAEGEG